MGKSDIGSRHPCEVGGEEKPDASAGQAGPGPVVPQPGRSARRRNLPDDGGISKSVGGEYSVIKMFNCG
jgi:hypothetical protein